MPPTTWLAAIRADDQHLTLISSTHRPATTLDQLLVAWQRLKRAEIARTLAVALGGAQ